jgi:hypothetical protein
MLISGKVIIPHHLSVDAMDEDNEYDDEAGIKWGVSWSGPGVANRRC